MITERYHVCVHFVLLAIIVILLREYWCTYALQHTHEKPLILSHDPPNHVYSREPRSGDEHSSSPAQEDSQLSDIMSDCGTDAGDAYGTVTTDQHGSCSSRTSREAIARDLTFSQVTTSTVVDYEQSTATVGGDVIPDPHLDHQPPVSDAVQHLIDGGSSVWCSGSNHTQRFCRFSNICYFPEHESFGFLHSEHSIISGVPRDRFSPALLDMSSVEDHNTQYFNYVDLPSNVLQHYIDIKITSQPTLAFNRFNADNLMHVFHDDLLPVFSTLQMINGSSAADLRPFDVQLLFMEGWQPGPYSDLYQQFTMHELLYKSDLTNTNTVTCFKDAYVGLKKDTTWYQYGFKIPQGPIFGHAVTSRDIRHFVRYFLGTSEVDQNSATSSQASDDGDYVVLFTRKHNRLILNEIELSMAIAKEYNMKVYPVGAETHSIREIIVLIESATVLIGMHGSLLILSMFLPPGAAIIELFPYAVDPDNYTPYKTLAGLKGMRLVYQSWRVTNIQHTVTHPDHKWDTGGIHHLPVAQQSRILSSQVVPEHLCCRDPEWLFRIYQDSIVDVQSVLSVINTAIHNRNRLLLTKPDVFLHLPYTQYPTHVQHIECNGSGDDLYKTIEVVPPALSLSWHSPWNLLYLNVSDVSYEIWIQESGSERYSAWILTRTQHTFTLGLKQNTQYSIWIRCILNNQIVGPFNQDHITCFT